MSDPKKKPVQKPTPQTFGLEFPALGELRLECDEPVSEIKPFKHAKKELVNEDLIHRLINCVKKI